MIQLVPAPAARAASTNMDSRIANAWPRAVLSGFFSATALIRASAAGAASLYRGRKVPTQATIFVSIVAAGFPVALSYGAMGLEFSVAQFARAAWRYWRQPRRFLAGPGQPSPGYVVLADPGSATPHSSAHPRQQGEPVWDV